MGKKNEIRFICHPAGTQNDEFKINVFYRDLAEIAPRHYQVDTSYRDDFV